MTNPTGGADGTGEAADTVAVTDTVTAAVRDADEAARQARFGALPERIRLEDTVQELPATEPDPSRDTYDSDEWLTRNAL